MATTLIWLVYLAGVVHSIDSILSLAIVGMGMASFFVTMFTHVNSGEFPQRFLMRMTVAASVVAVVMALTPSKQTIYMAAGVYLAAEASSTEEFQLVRQLVLKELRSAVEAK